MSKAAPKLSMEITTRSNTIRIYGKRSSKGWTVKRTGGASSTLIDYAPDKAKAIKLAFDCCDPDTHHSTFRIDPSR